MREKITRYGFWWSHNEWSSIQDHMERYLFDIAFLGWGAPPFTHLYSDVKTLELFNNFKYYHYLVPYDLLK